MTLKEYALRVPQMIEELQTAEVVHLSRLGGTEGKHIELMAEDEMMKYVSCSPNYSGLKDFASETISRYDFLLPFNVEIESKEIANLILSFYDTLFDQVCATAIHFSGIKVLRTRLGMRIYGGTS